MVIQVLSIMVALIWAASVVVRDLVTFQISNSSILWGAMLLWPAFYELNLRIHCNLESLFICILVLLFGFSSLIGMGDVKLILLLVPWLRQGNLSNTILLLIGFSWLQLIAISLIQRCFATRIAFAPAILLAAVLNMAT